MYCSAIILGCAVVSQHLQRRFAQLIHRNAIVYERRSQIDRPAAVARWGRDLREISVNHVQSRNVVRTGNGRGSLNRELRSTEKEQLVVNEWPTDRPAELIAFQRIANRREGVAGVESSVAHELKQISVKLIRAGLRHDVHGSRAVLPILRLQCARFDLRSEEHTSELQSLTNLVC